jgi:hypothetical protein
MPELLNYIDLYFANIQGFFVLANIFSVFNNSFLFLLILSVDNLRKYYRFPHILDAHCTKFIY